MFAIKSQDAFDKKTTKRQSIVSIVSIVYGTDWWYVVGLQSMPQLLLHWVSLSELKPMIIPQNSDFCSMLIWRDAK